MKAKVSEKLVSHIWQHQMITNPVTNAGEQLRIIHPGRVSNDSGCDFKDAVVTLNGKAIKGNIEIHVKSSQWYSHGHHQDPKYNSIVLHVVMWHDSSSPTLLHSGKAIPTISLDSSLTSPLNKLIHQGKLSHHHSPLCPEAMRYSHTESLNKLLDAAGEERFIIKTIALQKALIEEEACQVLFRGIARALGYSKNTEPFEELANRLPLSFLEKVEPDTSIVKQAWILGTAGLLPSQQLKQKYNLAKNDEIEKLENLWQSCGTTETMKKTDWCFFRVRPNNSPTHRLIALSYLITRYQEPGLLQGIIRLVKSAPPETAHCALVNGLTIAKQDYLAYHHNSGISKTKNSVLLGQSKAAAIVINIILPFSHAWGNIGGDSELREKAIAIYRRYPKLEDNELTIYMKQQLQIKPSAAISARQQQGLIHIFNTYCRYRSCHECPVALSQG